MMRKDPSKLSNSPRSRPPSRRSSRSSSKNLLPNNKKDLRESPTSVWLDQPKLEDPPVEDVVAVDVVTEPIEAIEAVAEAEAVSTDPALLVATPKKVMPRLRDVVDVEDNVQDSRESPEKRIILWTNNPVPDVESVTKERVATEKETGARPRLPNPSKSLKVKRERKKPKFNPRSPVMPDNAKRKKLSKKKNTKKLVSPSTISLLRNPLPPKTFLSVKKPVVSKRLTRESLTPRVINKEFPPSNPNSLEERPMPVPLELVPN